MAQRLLGPTAFPLDRVLAILGFLLDSYDLDGRAPGPEFGVPGAYTELELGRVHVYGCVRLSRLFFFLHGSARCLPENVQIAELAAMHLLQCTSPADKIDGPPTYKCGINYPTALALARGLGVPLGEMIWEVV